MKLALMAIFKNEAMGIREWVEHYIWQGVDTILLLDNISTDDWKSKIQDYLDVGKVTVLYAPDKYAQNKQYNSIGIPWLKEQNVDVLAILDLDEFIFGTDGKTFKEYVLEIFGSPSRPSRIFCKWTLFGSSNLEQQPESIRKSFTWKQKTLQFRPWTLKSISWFTDIKEGGAEIHASDVTGRVDECPPTMQLNHYLIQSKQYFKEVKMVRGAADIPAHEKLRDWTYFKQHDFHDLEDITLKNLVETLEKKSH